jgi:hypothetical protein
VTPDIAAALTGSAAPAVRETERRFVRGLVIEAAAALDREQFQIVQL